MTLIKRTSTEILILCGLACLCGLVANALHPDGVVLARNYFKVGPKKRPEVPQTTSSRTAAVNEPIAEFTPPSPVSAGDASNAVTAEVNTPQTPNAPPIAAQMEQPNPELRQDESGLNLADFDFVLGAWTAMNAGAPSVVFVDARKAEAYEGAHIAGAVLLDHYRLERYLPDLRERLLAAQVIVVYCAGDCEDSRYLATALIYDHDFPAHTLFLYEGGMAEWTERKQSVTQGAQP